MPHLDEFSKSWTSKEARHLLKRTTFGATDTEVNTSVSLGLTASIEKLFEEKPVPSPPVKYVPDGSDRNSINDPDANYGESWISGQPSPQASSNNERNKILRSRNRSLYAWSFLQMQNAEFSIIEKLTLFWHNHFVSENTNPHREYYYMSILRENAMGNFRELTKKITIDPNMLIYLNGNQNVNSAPNENYSRELLELFTIGKGDAIGNGDYTNYTEDDVVEMAKALTGWRTRSLTHEDSLSPYFANNKHTSGSKTLSQRFNNAVISENGSEEYKDVINTIFEQPECSRFITRQLYRWFVNSEISPEIETNIIEPLARLIRDNDYNITPALKKLFSSDHFYETTFCMIKSPIDYVFSATKSLQLNAPTTSVNEAYEFALVLYNACSDLEQSLFHHPDVAGWKAYYQEPLFYKTWVNNFLLPKRLQFSKLVVTGGDLVIDNNTYTIPPLVPVLSLAAGIQNSEDPNVLISELAIQLFNYPIEQQQIESLKEILIPGLPDFEWTVEYTDYLSDPSNPSKAIAVDNKLRSLLSIMVQMSEFQIM